MKNFLKKLFRISLIILICIVVCITTVKLIRFSKKASTFQYVKNNTEQLTVEALSVIESGIYANHQYDKTTVTYYPTAHYPIVEFSTGGFGIAPSGYYTGFYYSPQDIPVRFNGDGTAVEEYKNGWVYQAVGDNHGYTEKICNNWYWYKFWF